MRVRKLAEEPGGLQAVFTSRVEPWMIDFVYNTETGVIVFISGAFGRTRQEAPTGPHRSIANK
jgi:hypothetical protein